ncbi:MAG: hypothetical protein AcusKO_12110 [Acuticoccus sp.]
MLLILVKIAVTSAMVLTLATLTERAGPRIAGVLAGFPLGIAVSLFFIGIEEGAPFAAAASVTALGGLSAALAFCTAYWAATRGERPLSPARATVCACAAFIGAAGLLSLLPANRWLLAGVTLALAAIAARLYRRMGAAGTGALKAIRTGPRVLAIRAGIATALVLVVTGLAGVVGPRWAGLLAGFPVTLLPVLLIAHVTYSPRIAHGVIKGFPYGIGSLVVCALVASESLDAFGVYRGMAVAIGAAGIYLTAVCVVVLRADRPADEGRLPSCPRGPHQSSG